MASWHWLTKTTYSWRFVRNVIIKAALLFIILNVGYALSNPLPTISKITFYNLVFEGRERLPYADNPEDTYNINLHRLEGMFASHEINNSDKADSEFRVLALGDSGVWGWLLETNETLSSCLNQGNYQTADDRTLRVYNLGYPVTSVLKDALILEQGLAHNPDAVLWMTTLQAMYDDEQLRHPIMQNNPDYARDFVQRYGLDLDTSILPLEAPFLERTIIGQRRELADLIRHQLYGITWMVTGFDHTNPKFFEARVDNLDASEGIPSRDYINVGDDLSQYLSFEVINAAIDMATDKGVQILIVNEPIFQAEGLNSDLRYNDLYPRWAYDEFRQLITAQAEDNQWHFMDMWNGVPNEAFTDYPLHYTAKATCEFATQLVEPMLRLAES